MSGVASAELCHVTVQGSRRRADVALPASVPIVEFTPLVAALCEAADSGSRALDAGAVPREGTPPAWTLARVGGAPLDVESSLAEAGVLDGEVLHLVDAAAWHAPLVSDLADAVTGALDGDGRGWAAEARAAGLAALGGAFLVTAAAAGVATGTGSRAEGVLALLVAAGLAAALAWRRAVTRLATRLALGAGSVALAGLGGWAIAGGPGGPAGAAAAAAAVAIALAPLCAVVPALAPGCMLVAAIVAAGAGSVALGWGPAEVAGVVAAGGVVGLRLLPGLVGQALFARSRPDPAGVEASARISRLLLDSLSGGTVLLLTGAIVTLLVDGTGYAVGLALVGAAALVLRAQSYLFAPEALPPAAAGCVAVLAVGLALTWRFVAVGGRGWLAVVLLAGTGLALILVSASQAASSIPQRAPRWAWLAVDLSLGPLLLGQLGAYDAGVRLVQHFVQ